MSLEHTLLHKYYSDYRTEAPLPPELMIMVVGMLKEAKTYYNYRGNKIEANYINGFVFSASGVVNLRLLPKKKYFLIHLFLEVSTCSYPSGISIAVCANLFISRQRWMVFSSSPIIPCIFRMWIIPDGPIVAARPAFTSSSSNSAGIRFSKKANLLEFICCNALTFYVY